MKLSFGSRGVLWIAALMLGLFAEFAKAQESGAGMMSRDTGPADVVTLKDAKKKLQGVVVRYEPPYYFIRPMEKDRTVGAEQRYRVGEIRGIEFHQQVAPPEGSLALDVGFDSPAVAASAEQAWHYPDHIKVRGQNFIANVTGLSRGKLHFVTPDGAEHSVLLGLVTEYRSVSTDDLLGRAEAMKLSKQFAGSLDASMDASPDREVVFYQEGFGRLQRNSQPFRVDGVTLYVAAIDPDGPSPFASVMAQKTPGSDARGGSVNTGDVEFEGARVVVKLDYDAGAGMCYADVGAQSGRWFVAVVDMKRVPNKSEIDRICRELLLKAKWDIQTRVFQ